MTCKVIDNSGCHFSYQNDKDHKAQLHIDGIEMSGSITAVRFEHEAGKVPMLHVDLTPIMNMSGDAEIIANIDAWPVAMQKAVLAALNKS